MLVVIVVGYASLMTFGGCADKLLLHPSRGAMDAGGAQRVMLQHAGQPLEVWTAPSPALSQHGSSEPRAFVLEFCGNATRAEQITRFVADRWKHHPVEVWVPNYPGNGGSGGAATLDAIGPAALAAYDALSARAGGRRIFVAGNSMGTVAALHVASRRDCAGVILQNPPPLRELILGRYGWWNGWLLAGPVALQVPRGLDSIANAKLSRAPAVIVTAERDTLVPPKYQRRIIDAYGGPKRVIRIAATHDDGLPRDAEAKLAAAIDAMWNGQAEGRR